MIDILFYIFPLLLLILVYMPFCKICYDAGKPEYLTHNVKVYNIQLRCIEIICPYLKNITCTRCGKKQHTASYCKEEIINKEVCKPIINKELCKPIINKDNSLNKVNLVFSNLFTLLYQDQECESFELYDGNKISYTLDGEYLGKLSDIVWGKGISLVRNSWG